MKWTGRYQKDAKRKVVMTQKKADIFTLDKFENDSVEIRLFCYDLRCGKKSEDGRRL